MVDVRAPGRPATVAGRRSPLKKISLGSAGVAKRGGWIRCNNRVLDPVPHQVASEGRGDQVGVGLHALEREVDTVLTEVFGMTGACGVPVNECGIWVSLHPVGQYAVVRHRDRVIHVGRYRQVHYQSLTDAREHPHHLVERLGGEGAVVAYMDDHDVAELTGVAARPQDIDSSWRLEAALCIDGAEVGYLLLERVDGAEHHRVADGAHPARGRGGSGTRLLRDRGDPHGALGLSDPGCSAGGGLPRP